MALALVALAGSTHSQGEPPSRQGARASRVAPISSRPPLTTTPQVQLSSSFDYIPQCQFVLDHSKLAYAQLVAANALKKLEAEEEEEEEEVEVVDGYVSDAVSSEW